MTIFAEENRGNPQKSFADYGNKEREIPEGIS